MATVCIQDRFGSVHAHRIYGECNPAAIRRAAGYLARNASCDAGEHIQVGICAKNDPGAARLLGKVPYAEGGIEWLYEINVDELEG